MLRYEPEKDTWFCQMNICKIKDCKNLSWNNSTVVLPEGTAAVLNGTEPNMSVLPGSDWDEDGIKASPGVAGVYKMRQE